jgi:hypothetical protein
MAETLDLKTTLSKLPTAPSKDIQRAVKDYLRDHSSSIPILVALDDDVSSDLSRYNTATAHFVTFN